MIPLCLALVLAAGDPCALPVPGPVAPVQVAGEAGDAGDTAGEATAEGGTGGVAESARAIAAAYVAVGEAELTAGARETAAAAFRTALRHDPESAPARAGLAESCRPPPDVPGAGDPGAAEKQELAAGAVAATPDPAAALVAATAELRAGRDDRARVLLEDALQDPDTTAAAELLLALVARRGGEDAAARALLERAAAAPDRRVGVAAARLLGSSRREGRVAVAAYAGSSWDSNPSLAPDGTALADSADGAATSSIVVRVHPLGQSGPFATGGAEYRRHQRYPELDLSGWFAGAGLRTGGARGSAGIEYRFRELALGRAPFAVSHAARLDGHLRAGAGVALTALAELEGIRHGVEWAEGFAGVRAGGALRAAWIGRGGWVAAGYEGARFTASDRALSYVEHGPALEAGLVPTRRVRLSLEGSALMRIADVVDPAVGVARTETALEATLAGQVAIVAGLAARAELGGRRTLSNVPELTRGKVVASLGLVWEGAWP